MFLFRDRHLVCAVPAAAGRPRHIRLRRNFPVHHWSARGVANRRSVVRLVVKAASWAGHPDLRVQCDQRGWVPQQWNETGAGRTGTLCLCVSVCDCSGFVLRLFYVFYIHFYRSKINSDGIICSCVRVCDCSGFAIAIFVIKCLPPQIKSDGHHIQHFPYLFF